MPIFSLWIAREVMRGLLSIHGESKLEGQEVLSKAKADAIYSILDANPKFYQPVNRKEVRSRMNICFRVKDVETEKRFLAGAEGRMLQGLKGHRSVGGVRISNYNAVPMENVQKLAEYLTNFAQQDRWDCSSCDFNIADWNSGCIVHWTSSSKISSSNKPTQPHPSHVSWLTQDPLTPLRRYVNCHMIINSTNQVVCCDVFHQERLSWNGLDFSKSFPGSGKAMVKLTYGALRNQRSRNSLRLRAKSGLYWTGQSRFFTYLKHSLLPKVFVTSSTWAISSHEPNHLTDRNITFSTVFKFKSSITASTQSSYRFSGFQRRSRVTHTFPNPGLYHSSYWRGTRSID